MSSACPIFAFPVHFVPIEETDGDVRQTLDREWRAFAQGRGLQSRRRSGSGFDFIVTGEAMQASDADRVEVELWLRERSDLSDWTVGELRDLPEE
jgi:hypothetical protein